MARRLLIVAGLALVPAGAALGAKPVSWAAAEIRLLGQDPAAFRADETVTRGELADLLAGAGLAPAPVAKPEAPLTMQDLHARLVAALRLQPEAKAFATAAKTAGLQPTARFGTEVVARLLGLRKNHPAASDALERLPAQPASRAEAAYSVAQIVRFKGWEVAGVRESAAAFAVPELTAWQRALLRTALGLVGHPYVWAGTSGGFDCSGFVWRVFKLEPYADSGALASTLRGRTTYAMSGEIPKASRIAIAGLQPADVIFFGSSGSRSKPGEVGHMGIYVGNDWFVHSSRDGVALATLSGWYERSFAWARRPLAEAGLS
jgi:cell wall-associated NlpC family hydrolase